MVGLINSLPRVFAKNKAFFSLPSSPVHSVAQVGPTPGCQQFVWLAVAVGVSIQSLTSPATLVQVPPPLALVLSCRNPDTLRPSSSLNSQPPMSITPTLDLPSPRFPFSRGNAASRVVLFYVVDVNVSVWFGVGAKRNLISSKRLVKCFWKKSGVVPEVEA